MRAIQVKISNYVEKLSSSETLEQEGTLNG